MKKISIEITPEQEAFLKLFASMQYEGAPDNFGTHKPFHIVQSKVYKELPYSEDLENEYNDGEFVLYSINDSIVGHYSKPEEFIKIVTGKEPEHNWEDWHDTIQEYLEAYGIDPDNVNIWWKIPEYENKAYFFIRQEAKRYISYQRHNLRQPRIYTVTAGYSNFGEYEHFFDLLQGIGKKLIKEETAPSGKGVYIDVFDQYHSICKSLPAIIKLTEKRKTAIKARWNEYKMDVGKFAELFSKAEGSCFLKGENSRGWRATFDWLLNENNMAKVLEGNYDDKVVSNMGVSTFSGRKIDFDEIERRANEMLHKKGEMGGR